MTDERHYRSAFGQLQIMESKYVPPGTIFLLGTTTMIVSQGFTKSRRFRLALWWANLRARLRETIRRIQAAWRGRDA